MHQQGHAIVGEELPVEDEAESCLAPHVLALVLRRLHQEVIEYVCVLLDEFLGQLVLGGADSWFVVLVCRLEYDLEILSDAQPHQSILGADEWDQIMDDPLNLWPDF